MVHATVCLKITKESINTLIVDIIAKDIPCPHIEYFDTITDFIKRLNLHVAVNGIKKDEEYFFFEEDESDVFKLYSSLLTWQQYIEEDHPTITIDLPSILKKWNYQFYTESMKVMYTRYDYFRNTSFN